MHDDVMGIFAFHGERMSSYLKKCQKNESYINLAV